MLEIARFGVPLALGMVLQTLFNLVDAYLVAHLPVSEANAATGALGFCDQLAALGTIVSYGISTATSAVLSRHQGAGRKEEVQRAAWQSLLAVSALSLVFVVVGLAFAGPLVRFAFGAKGDVAAIATRYLRVVVTGSFSIFFLLHLTTIQRALGSAKTPVALLAIGNVINLFLAVLLIFGDGPRPGMFAWGIPIARALHIPRMGMMGAAWATVIARALVLLPIVWITMRRFPGIFTPPDSPGIDRRRMRELLTLAWPSSSQFVLRMSGMIFVHSLVARFFTTEGTQTATTAMGLVFRIDSMALFVAMGWGSAAQTFVGQNLGAGLVERARWTGWITGGYDALTNVAYVALLLGHALWALSFFSSDAASLAIAIRYVALVAPSYLGLGFGIALGNAMAGAGATKRTMALDATLVMLIQIPLCAIGLAQERSLDRLFICVALSNWIGAIVYTIAYARPSWLKRREEGPVSV